MSASVNDSNNYVASAPVADDAVGVEIPHWYIAVVSNRSEKKNAASLLALGYENFVAIQKEYHIWSNGKKKMVDQIVLPAMVFVRATEPDRKAVLANLPFIKRFVVDPARRNGFSSPVAVIPDEQMQTLQFMLENAESPVSFDGKGFRSGDRVRVVGGQLNGLEGTVRQSKEGKSRLYVSMDILGFAIVEMDRRYLKHIN